MALIIDNTVGGPNANSYVDEAEADAIMEADFHKQSIWNGFDSTQKTQLLVSAVYLLDNYEFIGYRTTEEQALKWPRTGVVDSDGYAVAENVIPDEIKRAQVQLAVDYSQSDAFADSGTEGFDKIKVGSIELGINADDRPSLQPDYISDLIGQYLTAGAGGRQAPVYRV